MTLTSEEFIRKKDYYQKLSRGHFHFRKSFLKELQELEEAGKVLESHYFKINKTLDDEKLSRAEIGKLQSFLSLKIPEIWNDKWEPTYNQFLRTLDNFSGIYEKIDYIISVE